MKKPRLGENRHSPYPRHAALALAEHCQRNAEIGRNRLVEPRRAANARRSSWS
jgi:hypothetical protein